MCRDSSDGHVSERPGHSAVPLSKDETFSFLHVISLGTPGAVGNAVNIPTKPWANYPSLSSAALGEMVSPHSPREEKIGITRISAMQIRLEPMLDALSSQRHLEIIM